MPSPPYHAGLGALGPRIGLVTLMLLGSTCGSAYLDPEPELRRFELSVEAEITGSSAPAATLWLPVPTADAEQELGPVRPAAAGGDPREGYDAWGNRFLSVTGRTPLRLAYTVEVRRLRVLPPPEPSESGMASAHDAWLAPAALAPLEPVRKEALFVAASHVGAWAKARALFDFVVEAMTENRPAGGGWGRGDLGWAWRVRGGDASDISAVLVALCQSVGIPASFEVGWSLQRERSTDWRQLEDRHCWARIFISGFGWLPADATMAHREKGRRDFWFGGLDAARVRFGRGRDLVLVPPQQGAPRNILDGPHAEASDGTEIRDVVFRVRYRDLEADSR